MTDDTKPVLPERDPHTWIQTFTGRKFWPLDPRAEDVCIDDIAHALATKCRWTGHAREPISIAQHSVWVATLCGQWSRSEGWPAPAMAELAGLLHDATEAYLPDVARPVKHATLLRRPGETEPMRFSTHEDLLMSVICDGLGVPALFLDPRVQKLVKRADTAVLWFEAQHGLVVGTSLWTSEPPKGVPDWQWNAPMDWRQAERAFIGEWRRLTGTQP